MRQRLVYAASLLHNTLDPEFAAIAYRTMRGLERLVAILLPSYPTVSSEVGSSFVRRSWKICAANTATGSSARWFTM